MALPSRAPAAPRPARCNSTTISSGSVTIAACDRNPIATADRNAPSTIILPDASIASGVRDGSIRCRVYAAASAAWAARVTASPGTSLMGRSALNQYNGLATASIVASGAAGVRRVSGSAESSFCMFPKSDISGKIASAPKMAPRMASAFASDGMMAREIFPSAMKTG